VVFSKRFRQVFDYSAGCAKYYVDNFGFTLETAENLCNGGELGISTFSFEDQ